MATLCTDDRSYQSLRAMARDAGWQRCSWHSARNSG
jgi:hypothetical protein